MLGRLDDIGPHPLAVDPRDLGEAGQNRLQRRRAHLDGLLHHVVEPGVFQRRKDVGEVGQAVLWPGPGDDMEAVGPFASGDRGLPFAVAPVEHQDGSSRRQPQHIAEIIALAWRERDRLAGGERCVDKQPGTAKIELRHEHCSNPRAFYSVFERSGTRFA